MKYFKLKVVLNTPIDITKNLQETKDYFLKHGISLEIKTTTDNLPLTTSEYLKKQGFNPITGKAELVGYYGLNDSIRTKIKSLIKENDCDIAIIVWDIDKVKQPNGVITSFTMSNSLYPDTEYIQIAINQYIKENFSITNRITHEIMHALCFMASRKGYYQLDEMDKTKDGKDFYKNDDPNDIDGNYARTFKNLQPFLGNGVKYKYFSESEVKRWKLKPDLWVLLDKMRGECGFPFNITSGLRTKDENDSLKDSVSDSAHLSGLAVDIACKGSSERFKMVQVAFANGITRIGIGKTFVHMDIDKSKVGNVMWHYY